MSIITLGRHLPTIPVHLSEAVEQYARGSGRHARLHFVPQHGWFAAFDLKADDPRLKGWQEGRASEKPYEKVRFAVPNRLEGKEVDLRAVEPFKDWPLMYWCWGMKKQPTFLELDLIQMGAGGVTEFLEADSGHSGRGRYKNIFEVAKQAEEQNKRDVERLRKAQEDRAGKRFREEYRHRFKIPFLPVSLPWLRSKSNAKET